MEMDQYEKATELRSEIDLAMEHLQIIKNSGQGPFEFHLKPAKAASILLKAQLFPASFMKDYVNAVVDDISRMEKEFEAL